MRNVIEQDPQPLQIHNILQLLYVKIKVNKDAIRE